MCSNKPLNRAKAAQDTAVPFLRLQSWHAPACTRSVSFSAKRPGRRSRSRALQWTSPSIAMGNASDEVKRQACATTDTYDDEGFAKAVERFILS